MMAAAAERGGGPGSSPPGSSPPGPSQPAVDYSLLVVVGALRPAGLLERLLRQIDSGERQLAEPQGGKSSEPFTIKLLN